MSSFSDNNLAKKLTELNSTQQSIQTLSLWLIHHRKHAKTIVEVWHREIFKCKPPKKLTFLYLANDVIQNGKKKAPEFAKNFQTVMAASLSTAVKEADEKQIQSMGRILNIWLERGVFGKDFVKQLRHVLETKGASDTPPPAKKKKQQQNPIVALREEVVEVEDLGEPPEHDDLVKFLSDLEHSASSDAAVREKIAALPPKVSDISLLEKIKEKAEADELSVQVDEACALLTDYNKQLAAELEERKRLAKLVRSFIKSQKDIIHKSEEQLVDFKTKLSKVAKVSNELTSHIQNLPDLTLLPDVSGGLAPLPSAGDLFSLSLSR